MKEIIWISDFFAAQLTGGAELTHDATIEASPYPVQKTNSANVTYDFIENNKDKKWVLGNIGQLTKDNKLHIATTCDYSFIECDYFYCKYRSSHLHELQEKKPCDCHKTEFGKLAIGMFKRAKSVHFMSNGQLDVYKNLFPQMASWEPGKLVVQGSTFAGSTLDQINDLALGPSYSSNEKYFIQGGGSTSWIKNTQGCVKYCEQNKLPYDVVGGLKPEDFLKKLSQYQGLVFLPAGYDTNPRITIEAKLLGLELILNNNVQQKDDVWFNLPPGELLNYLYELPHKFWKDLK